MVHAMNEGVSQCCTSSYRTLIILSISLLALGVLLTSAALAAPTISYVQGNYVTPQSSQPSVSVVFNSAQTSGNLNVVVVGWNDSTVSVTSVTDSSGNIYQRAIGPTAITGV